MKTRTVTTSQGNQTAVAAKNARQTYVPLPSKPAGQSATYGANTSAVIAGNSRQTHVV
jgi:hypothetical protein